MLSQQIRQKFLQFFQKKGHTILPSSPVVPHDDPSLLFTNAGMNQFKPEFLGRKGDYTKVTTAQKCVRVGGKHNDLDNVGHTNRHLTFFEMLGNFSFGDYFKKEAIEMAWKVSTEVFQLEAEKIWITVFRDDDEAFELWKTIVPEARIVRMDEKDNFWSMGDTGPCGPCSELYFDRGSAYADASSLLHDPMGTRFLEFWNLVFMQFNRDIHGKMDSLPKPSIDTGSGLERVVALKMEVDNVFATDILRSLIAQVEHVSNRTYKAQEETIAPAFHVIADHIRSLSFAIADGAQPSNVDRGYVLRKLIRRAVRYGRLLGLDRPFLADVVPRLIELMGKDYPELISSQTTIQEVLTQEEESFLQVLKRGGNILSSVMAAAEHRSTKEITGQEAFKLKDTYGFPIEEILLMAKDAHLSVNLDAYQLLEKEAKEKSKSARGAVETTSTASPYQELTKTVMPTLFIGYTHVSCEAVVQALFVDGQLVPELHAGQKGVVILDQTPFYAEKGGQIADTGVMITDTAELSIVDCQILPSNVILHTAICRRGQIRTGQHITASVDHVRRKEIQNHHTATHLLHWALNQVIGAHIKQAGSLVERDRLRFDFNHHKPLSQDEIWRVEDLVNQQIRNNDSVSSYEIPYEEAQKHREIKQFFGDKYGANVRVIDIMNVSKELCGGTHTSSTGTLGYFRILKEGSIAAGVRRIEATVGKGAEQFARDVALQLQTDIAQLSVEIKTQQLEIKAARKLALRHLAAELNQQKLPFISAIVQVKPEELNALAEEVATLAKHAVIALAIKEADRCQVVVRVTPDYVKKGVDAAKILKETAAIIGGSGGGKSETAQAGGKLPENLEKLFSHIQNLVRGIS